MLIQSRRRRRFIVNSARVPKNPLRADPTRTATLRRQFEEEMTRRFARFRRKLVSLVVDEDAFGLKPDRPFSLMTFDSEFASTQLNVTDPECLRRIRELQARLDSADVLKLETEPHVTVRWGLYGQDAEAVRELMEKTGPVWMTVGRLSLFQQPEHDVLYLSVESQGLERLNAELAKLPHTDTHDEYIPHITVAYLRPGTGYKYLADPSFLEWQSYAFTELTFSDRERQQTRIALNVFCPTGEGGGVDPSCSPEGSAKDRAVQMTKATAETFGIPAPKVNIVTDDSGKTWGEHGGDTVHLVNPNRKALINKQINFKLDHDVTEGEHIAAHETIHQVYTADPEVGQEMMKRLKAVKAEYGSAVSMYGALEGAFENLMELGAVYSHSPEALKRYSPEMHEIAHDWAAKSRMNFLSDNVQNTRWKFNTSAEKVKEFLRWLERELKPILTDEATVADDWWLKYVERGFRKGAMRSYDDMKRAGAIPQGKLPFYLGQRDEFLRSSFRQPESVEKVKLLAGRVFTELKGVTDAMGQKLTRTLTDGLVQGMNPKAIATRIVEDVNGIGIRRARVIARTEIIRAHSEGQLDSLERLGVKQLAVMVEWSTAGDERVCPLCRPLEGIVLTMDEAKGLLPRHPNCRCAWVPANVGESTEDQLRTAAKIGRAIKRSMAAGKPKRGKSKSTWLGATRKIGKVRPRSKI